MLFDVHAAIDPGQIYLGCLVESQPILLGDVALNSHEFAVGAAQKPNSRGLCTQHKDSLIQTGMILPNQRSLDLYSFGILVHLRMVLWNQNNICFGGDWTPQSFSNNMDVCLG